MEHDRGEALYGDKTKRESVSMALAEIGHSAEVFNSYVVDNRNRNDSLRDSFFPRLNMEHVGILPNTES